MASRLEAHLDSLATPELHRHLTTLRRGIEKESVRVLPSGLLSQAPHPAALGSPLTHPRITTDFSEAQLELITGVHDTPEACLAELIDIHSFVYRHIDDELMWAASMPCMLSQEHEVPVGRYGTSNVGRAKTVYRLGLGVRYGRFMQTISGVHYNFSVPDGLWPAIARTRGVAPTQETRTAAYFDLIRNFRRHSWLLIHLFGASPAICKSFVKGRPHRLECFDEGSLYLPHATSLRMGRLGYQSDAQSSLYVSFNSFAQYADALREALTRPYPDYERIGVKANGEYQQLNTALLQIENEFYGTIRPKRRTRRGERTLVALYERGVEYVEVRCLDIDPFEPAGISAETMRFLDVFLLHCLFADSPPDTADEIGELRENQQRVVEEGRRPGLELARDGRSVSFDAWARSLLDECRPIAELLDRATASDAYTASWDAQRARLDDPSHTPSARILDTMRSERIPFFRFAMNQSIAHKRWYTQQASTGEGARNFDERAFDSMASESLARQRELEASDRLDFDEYLRQYLRLPEFEGPL